MIQGRALARQVVSLKANLRYAASGGKLSNRYRSYSDHNAVNERKFQLVLAALNHQYKVSIKSHGCEGRAVLVDYIGISQ